VPSWPSVLRAARSQVGCASVPYYILSPRLQLLVPPYPLRARSRTRSARERAPARCKRVVSGCVIAARNQARSMASPEHEDEKMCRVCWGDEDDGPLVRPCACRGSAEWIHKACLEEWRRTGPREDAAYRCGQCKDEYRDALSIELLSARLQAKRTNGQSTVFTLDTLASELIAPHLHPHTPGAKTVISHLTLHQQLHRASLNHCVNLFSGSILTLLSPQSPESRVRVLASVARLQSGLLSRLRYFTLFSTTLESRTTGPCFSILSPWTGQTRRGQSTFKCENAQARKQKRNSSLNSYFNYLFYRI